MVVFVVRRVGAFLRWFCRVGLTGGRWKRGREKAGAAGRVAIAVIAAAAAGKTLGKTASRARNRFQQPGRLATGGRAFISKPFLVIRKICVNRNFRFLSASS
jgi:hypothetical protein